MERLIYKQTVFYMDQFLFRFIFHFRKGLSAHHALLSLIEKWGHALGNEGYDGPIKISFWKPFDTISHYLLIAMLQDYSFFKESLKLIKHYVTNKLQRSNLNTGFWEWNELLLGVAQGLSFD